MQSTRSIPLRAFGSEPGDLLLDFDAAPPPELATGVIAACAGIEPDRAWKLTVGERLRLLLAIAARGTAGEWPVEVACSGCATVCEVDLTAGELLERQPQPALLRVTVDGTGVLLRLPTGEDQAAWLRHHTVDEGEAVLLALRSLVEDAGGRDLSREFLGRLLGPAEAALESADPLVDFRIVTECPECGKELAATVDWTAFAFERLRRQQRGLIETVHRLASRYHWSEAEIFAVPAWRRDLYLSALEREGN